PATRELRAEVSSGWPPPIACAITVVDFPSSPSLRYDSQARRRRVWTPGRPRRPVETWENLTEELRIPFHLVREEEEGAVGVRARARRDDIIVFELRQMMLDRRIVEAERARDLVRVEGPILLQELQDPTAVVAAAGSREQVDERPSEVRVEPFLRLRGGGVRLNPGRVRPCGGRLGDCHSFGSSGHCEGGQSEGRGYPPRPNARISAWGVCAVPHTEWFVLQKTITYKRMATLFPLSDRGPW